MYRFSKLQMRTIRNLAHYIVGFTILYYLGNATNVNDFYVWQKIIGGIIIGSIGGIGLGAIWEFLNLVFFTIKPDENDVLRTWIGGILGMLCAVIFKDLHFISTWMLYGCITLVIADLIRATIKKYKK